ncbi:hypothetical protein [Sodalis glossinidius]|uniref:hypothetical protein n=1 Tax=Sodalis glossinidius TaxID=63612 RepID=UPI0011D11A11|nr:hypothetical protein [Sodalis glossinidius]
MNKIISAATATPESHNPAASSTAAHHSGVARPGVPLWTEMMQHIRLHYRRIHYDNFIGDERWQAINHVQARGMTEDFFTHYFDPLLRDIFSTIDRGQGIPLPTLLDNIHLRLTKEMAELSNLTALLDIGVMDGFGRQINQIRQTLAATFPAALVSVPPVPITTAGHGKAPSIGNA